MLHTFCIKISSQLREICHKEKQQFRLDSLPLSLQIYFKFTNIKISIFIFYNYIYKFIYGPDRYL